MTTVNLLPWREQRRQFAQQRLVRSVWLVLLTSLLLVWGGHRLLTDQLQRQQQRNAFLQRHLNELNERQQSQQTVLEQRDRLALQLARLQWIYRNPASLVELLETLVQSVPERLYLTSLTQHNDLIELTGRVDAAANLTPLLRRLGESDLIDDASLINIETDGAADQLASHRFLIQLRSQRLGGAPDQ